LAQLSVQNVSGVIASRDISAADLWAFLKKHLWSIGIKAALGVLAVCALARIYYLLAHPKRSIAGKLVLITGAGGGLGKQEALAFAKEGANLVLIDFHEDSVNSVVKEVKALYPTQQVWGYAGEQADVTKPEAVYALAEKVKKECGTVWCLVNNAGVVSGTLLMDTPDKMIRKTFDVNTLAHFWTTKAYLPAMLENNDGQIVTIASLAGFFASPKLVDYSASKFGARGFAEGLRMELRKLGKTGVKSSVICPGHIKTDLFQGYSVKTVPSLEPSYVAWMVVYAVQHGREVVMLPASSYMGVFAKSFLPTGIMDTINEWSGISDAMNDFKGVQVKPSFEASK